MAQFGTQQPKNEGQQAENTMTQGSENGPEATDRRIEDSKNLKPEEGATYTPPIARDPSAREAGVDVEKFQENDPVTETLGQVRAADMGATKSDVDQVIYSSHPIQNLHIGPYRFENSVLHLKPEQEGDFRDLIEQLPAADRLTIRKLDLGKVDEIAQGRRDAATKSFDSAVGRAALEQLRTDTPTIGTKPIDGNQDVEKLDALAAGSEADSRAE